MSGVKFGKTSVPSHAYPILGRIRGLKGVMPVISSLRKFDVSDVARERMRILSFYEPMKSMLQRKPLEYPGRPSMSGENDYMVETIISVFLLPAPLVPILHDLCWLILVLWCL